MLSFSIIWCREVKMMVREFVSFCIMPFSLHLVVCVLNEGEKTGHKGSLLFAPLVNLPHS